MHTNARTEVKKMLAEKYTTRELMAVCCAHEIKNGEVVFMGIGLPMMGGQVASKTHAKDAILVYEGGGVGAISRRVPWSIGDNPTAENALMVHEMWRLFSDGQAGYINRGVIGGAQIDKFGNLNTTVIMGGKSYESPAVRLSGSGGANDIASSCGETTIVMQMDRGFREKIDFITSPGHLTGPGARKKAGLVGNGPTAVITQKCVLRFEELTKEMYLDALFPGETVEGVKSLVDWDLKVAPDIKVVTTPTIEEIDIIHTLDPKGFMLGAKSDGEEDFEKFFQLMKQAYEAVEINLG